MRLPELPKYFGIRNKMKPLFQLFDQFQFFFDIPKLIGNSKKLNYRLVKWLYFR